MSIFADKSFAKTKMNDEMFRPTHQDLEVGKGLHEIVKGDTGIIVQNVRFCEVRYP